MDLLLFFDPKKKLHELLSKDGESNTKDVEKLIEKHPDIVSKVGEDGLLPLHTAIIHRKSVEVINVLLKADPDAAGKKCKGFRDILPLRDDWSMFDDTNSEGENVEKTNEGTLPLSLALEVGASDDVVLAVLNAAKESTDGSTLPLHLAIQKQRSLDLVMNLFDTSYPEGADTRMVSETLTIALTNYEQSEEVVLAILQKYPDAATGEDSSGILPLHVAIQRKRSLKIIRELLKLHPEGAKKMMKEEGRTKGILPLGLALETDSSDDVVLDVLAAYTDAAKYTLPGSAGLLPLHFATRKKMSKEILKALIRAYPDGARCKDSSGALPLHLAFIGKVELSEEGIEALLDVYADAAKEANPTTNILPLHEVILLNGSDGIILSILNAYPHASKRLMEDGRLPIEVCAERGATENLMLALLEVDMPILSDGTPVKHSDSWSICVAADTEGAAGAVRRILSKADGNFGKHVHALADVRDAKGRSALELAASRSRATINEYLLLCGRYRLQTGAPEHRTRTSVVLRAKDLDKEFDYDTIFDDKDKDKIGKLDLQEVLSIATSIGFNPELFMNGSEENESISKEDFIGNCKRQLGDGPREVVIKLMQKKDQWKRELNARDRFNLNSKYVVSALQRPSMAEIEDAVKRSDGGLEIIVKKFLDGNKPGKYAIVMDAADRNLQQIFHQERPNINAVRGMLKQVFEAVNHLHEKELMHGDLNMRNIVRMRTDNRLRIIDFDASARIFPMGEKEESFAGAKFSMAILPPEMIGKIETVEQLEEFNKYWKVDGDDNLFTRVSPMLYKKHGAVIGQYFVKSFRTKDGEPVDKEKLPYTLVKASANIDAWSLGVLTFTLLTGESLIPSTRDDDCVSGASMHLLYYWGEQPDAMSDELSHPFERFNKIIDDAARDLVIQLLQKDPAKRPTIDSLLKKHPFFHPERVEEIQEHVCQMKARLKEVDATLQCRTKQMEILNGNIAVIKKLSDQSKAELFRTRHDLLKSTFAAAKVNTPTTFIILNKRLPPKPCDEQVKETLSIAEARDGSDIGISVNGTRVELFGDLKVYYEQVKSGIEWVKGIESVGSKVAKGKVGGAFEIINEGMKDLISGDNMYLYLVDELTGEPVRANGWPITISKPLAIVPKLIPLMQVGMRGASVCNGIAGLAKMVGFPASKVPEAWSEGAQESVELLKKDSSVGKFGILRAQVEGGMEVQQSVCDASLREFVDFLQDNDPGLKENKSGDFAGLQCIGNPEDGAALWTTLTDPEDIEAALKERSKQREAEQIRHLEYTQKKSFSVEMETNAPVEQKAPAAVAGNNCCTKFMLLLGLATTSE